MKSLLITSFILALLLLVLRLPATNFSATAQEPTQPIFYSVEILPNTPLTNLNTSINGLETPPTYSVIGDNFTVEIHLRNATATNIPNGVQGVEVHFYFGNILDYCKPIGFTDELGQKGRIWDGGAEVTDGVVYAVTAGFYDDNWGAIDTPPYTNATFYRVAAGSTGYAWNGDDGLVAKITFQITAQPLHGQPDYYMPLRLQYVSPWYLVDAYGTEIPFSVTQGTLRIDAPHASTLKGDVDCDGKVGLQDLTLLARAYGSQPGDLNWNENADFANTWNLISESDLTAVAANYGKTTL